MRFSPGCSCCLADCCGCAVVPAAYNIDTSGINCDLIGFCSEDTYRLDILDDCGWRSIETCAYTGSYVLVQPVAQVTATLACDSEYMWLTVTITVNYDGSPATYATCHTAQALYKKLLADWDCMGSNTLAFHSSDVFPDPALGTCVDCTWPANLTVVPTV